MAVIVKEKIKGSGEWWVFINHKGKRRSKKIGSKKAAIAVKREVEARPDRARQSAPRPARDPHRFSVEFGLGHGLFDEQQGDTPRSSVGLPTSRSCRTGFA